jgi:Ca-activated chloride channel family protein
VVDASPDIAPLLADLASRWARTSPAVGRTCVAVSVAAKDSALMATALATDWDPQINGPAPDVWVPASSVWVREASVSDTVARMIPDRQPSLARTPAVIAMPKRMAAALGEGGEGAFDWPDLARDAKQSEFWGTQGQPGWGRFSYVMTDPKTSTAGLLTLMAIADANNDGTVDTAEQFGVLGLKQTMRHYLGDTSDVLAAIDKLDGTSADAVLGYISAFPALERDVITYDRTSPQEPLAALYPDSGSFDADYPYLVLENGPAGHRPGARDAAAAFLAYARGPLGRAAFLADGFRDPNRTGGALHTVANGVEQVVTPLPRAVLAPDSVEETLTDWTAVTRGTNMLLVLDISGSMKVAVAGTKTRLDLAKQAAEAAIAKFDGQANIGLWVFSSALNGTRDYRELVPLGPLGDDMPDGRTRQAEMIADIRALQPRGDTGLYDTVAAAQAAVAGHFQPNETNLVVLMTDGKNDDPTGGLTLDGLTAKLAANKRSKSPVPVVTIGIGAAADFATLRKISHATGTASLSAKADIAIDDVLLAAIFGTLSGGT